MSGLLQPIIALAAKFAGGLLSLLSNPLKTWWKRSKISPASGEKLSILVAKLGGDIANSTHLSIREAISAAMPEVSVMGWPEELPIGDGLDDAALLFCRWQSQKLDEVEELSSSDFWSDEISERRFSKTYTS